MDYIVGQPVTVFIEDIKNADGTVVDPVGLTLTLRRPNGSLQTVAMGALTHVATGSYVHVVVPAAGQEGEWAWRFEASLPNTVGEGVFNVLPSVVLTGDAAQLTTGPCHRWTNQSLIEDGWTMPADTSDAAIELAISAASDACFQLGGQRWPGLCDRTVTPGSCGMLALPLPEGGEVSWRPILAHPARRFGMCGGGDALDLGVYPVQTIAEVREDGVAMDAADWSLWKNRWLVRTSGSWACLSRPWDDPPPLEVDLTFGLAPPALGTLAATALARELILAFAQSDACRLDRRVRSITRENVTMDFAIPGLAESLASGQTGIPEVDLFVVSHNPNRLRRAARFVNI